MFGFDFWPSFGSPPKSAGFASLIVIAFFIATANRFRKPVISYGLCWVIVSDVFENCSPLYRYGSAHL